MTYTIVIVATCEADSKEAAEAAMLTDFPQDVGTTDIWYGLVAAGDWRERLGWWQAGTPLSDFALASAVTE